MLVIKIIPIRTYLDCKNDLLSHDWLQIGCVKFNRLVTSWMNALMRMVSLWSLHNQRFLMKDRADNSGSGWHKHLQGVQGV